MFTKIDQAILNYWSTSPDQRVWAYLATLIPVLFVATEINYLF